MGKKLFSLALVLMYFLTPCCFGEAKVCKFETCERNCSTTVRGYNKVYGTFNFISCSVSSHCKNATGYSPVMPVEVRSDGWCLKTRGEGHYDDIMLDFFWRPNHSYSIKYLRGYEIVLCKLTKDKKNLLNCSELRYCFDTQLDYYRHVRAIFSYRCFGLSEADAVLPGDHYIASVGNIPFDEKRPNTLLIRIAIPDCSDKAMENVEECAVRRQLALTVEEVFCRNRSARVSFYQPLKYVMASYLDLYQQNNDRAINNSKVIAMELGQLTRGTLYNVTLAFGHDASLNYSLHFSGNGTQEFRLIKDLSFAHCLSKSSSLEIVAVSIGIGLIVLLLAMSCCYIVLQKAFHLRRLSKKITHFKRIRSTVLVACVDEKTKRSRNVAEHLSRILHNDLEFAVDLFLWRDIDERELRWLRRTLENDRIVVIWSQAACNLWETDEDERGTHNSDLFLPILNHIYNSLLESKNRVDTAKRFIFVTFENSEELNLPKEFQGCKYVALPNQFEKLYRLLVGIKQKKHLSSEKNEKLKLAVTELSKTLLENEDNKIVQPSLTGHVKNNPQNNVKRSSFHVHPPLPFESIELRQMDCQVDIVSVSFVANTLLNYNGVLNQQQTLEYDNINGQLLGDREFERNNEIAIQPPAPVDSTADLVEQIIQINQQSEFSPSPYLVCKACGSTLPEDMT